MAVVAMIAGQGPARGDELVLRGGGTLQGELVEIEGRPGSVEVYTATSTRPYVMSRDKIARVVPEDTPLDVYLERLEAVGDSADEHFALGSWAEDQGLSGPARHHYRLAVERDENHGPAHEKLGHVLFDDQWMTYDELREAQGLVKYDGEWMTHEQKERLDDHERLSRSQESWARRIDVLLTKYNEGAPAERAEAERQLRAIREPEAIVPLVNRLGHEAPALRLLLAEVLGAIDDPMATAGLVHRILKEVDEQIRRPTLDTLARRRDPEATDRLIAALEDDDPRVVGRAAAALAGLGAVEAVPKLVPKLVSIQHRIETILVPSAPSGGGFGLTAGFSRSGALATAGSNLATRSNVSTSQSIPVLTGPAVAPGAVAFGAQAVPVPSLGTTSAGLALGSSATGQTMPVPRRVVVPYPHRNVEVLAALERLTGEDFGYNINAWRRWLRTGFQAPEPDDRPARRIPQP